MASSPAPQTSRPGSGTRLARVDNNQQRSKQQARHACEQARERSGTAEVARVRTKRQTSCGMPARNAS
jgi:hypothetical protein